MAARPPLSLKARALQWLAQREHSRLELRRKLLDAARRNARAVAAARTNANAGAGASDGAVSDALAHTDPGPEIDALLDWLVAHRHLSDSRFVESRVHARAARFGNRRIAHELAQHGAALDASTAEQLKISEFSRAQAIWQRKYSGQVAAEVADQARQMRFLAGRGFSADVIRKVVQGSIPED